MHWMEEVNGNCCSDSFATPAPEMYFSHLCHRSSSRDRETVIYLSHTASAKEIDLSLCSKNEDDVFPNNTNLVIDKPKDNG